MVNQAPACISNVHNTIDLVPFDVDVTVCASRFWKAVLLLTCIGLLWLQDNQISWGEFQEIIKDLLNDPEHRHIMDRERSSLDINKVRLTQEKNWRATPLRDTMPWNIRDSGGIAATLWDILQSLLLLYIAAMVNPPFIIQNFIIYNTKLHHLQ